MSVDVPTVAVVFGAVTPPQGDVVGLQVHLGCTKEVSSFEVVLQNWNGKYSPNGPYPIVVGLDGSLSVGRGANCPLLLTCRVENVKYQSSPTESYLTVKGRCWGERLFRRVVSKTCENLKGEDIVKELLDYYIGLSHIRNGVELVESTDTTYTRLQYSDTPVMDILQEIADTADNSGVIGYDFRIAPDGKFEFFPKNSKNTAISLSERLESSEYSKDISRVRNKVTVYGAADKSIPLDKDEWTESLTPTGGTWIATSGTISLDSANKIKGLNSIKTSAQNLNYAACQLILNSGNEVDADLYPTFNLWLCRDASFNGNVTITLYDINDGSAAYEISLGAEKWFQTALPVGNTKRDCWQVLTQFNWHMIKQLRVTCWFDGVGTGSFWVDGVFFGGRQYSSMQEDMLSQNSIGLRELVEVNEELCSDLECESHAKALLSNLKDPAERLTLKSTVIDYGTTPILAGDTVHVNLPNEGVNGDFRVQSIEYNVDAKMQTLEITLELGREKPMLADYLYALRSRTSHLSRYKSAKH
ncbi:MAG: siphovirus ReqiPepy6 Gp37-like family protein [Candidatus Bathyarchaeota archaeon]|nr:siphovirus ReqiPepy6 Gp37-like family protein [Candidatus Bathyarchaeota archaeon]